MFAFLDLVQIDAARQNRSGTLLGSVMSEQGFNTVLCVTKVSRTSSVVYLALQNERTGKAFSNSSEAFLHKCISFCDF